MNILIMTDLEGISCVERAEQMGGEGYRFACERLMLDLNAAVEGAIEGGANKIYVVDGHGGSDNFIDGMLHPAARKCGLDEWADLLRTAKVDAYMAVGCHAMAGTSNGFLDHTMSSVSWHDYYINGRRSGEIAIGAMFTGAFNVPMVMVSGDEAACVEARAFCGDIATASVKFGIGRNKAKCLPSQTALDAIKEAAKQGVRLAESARLYRPVMPAEIILEFNRSDYCDEAFERCGKMAERLDARRLRKLVTKIERYFDLLY